MLAWVDTMAVVTLREGFRAMGDAGLRLGPVIHNQSGTLVAWSLRHLSGTLGDTGQWSRYAVWELARRHWLIKNLLADVFQGARGFEVSGDTIRMPFIGDPKLDALDRLLDVLHEIRGLDVEGRPHGSRVIPWMDAGGRDTPWHVTPRPMQEHFRTAARALMRSYPTYLPEDLDVGGFRMGQAADVLVELLARAQHSQACLMRGSTSVHVTTPFARPEEFVDDLTLATDVARSAVECVVVALTADLSICDDPCLTPIVPVGESLVHLSSLTAPGSPVRNLTARLQLEPSRFGAAGRALGQLGVDRCAETLRRVAGARMATNIDLVSPSGKRVGDLDLVLVDPSRRLMAVFEIMWQIRPDGSVGIGKALGKAHAKRSQVAQNRKLVTSGLASPRWPTGWPDVSDYATRWFILTPDVLPVAPSPDDIGIRSQQMLGWLLRAHSSLPDLIRLLDDPPTPPEPVTELHWSFRKFGRYRVEWDQVVA